MRAIEHVHVAPTHPQRFKEVLAPAEAARLDALIVRAQALLEGRAVWSVSSTARGGGVAELLHSLISYTRGAGVNAQWCVLRGPPEFFAVTKRLHNLLHGSPGDGAALDESARAIYEVTTHAAMAELATLVRPGDIVLLHDPQTAGLTAPVKALGVPVVWRCHVGVDRPSPLTERAWNFLRPYVAGADRYVFSRRGFAWPGLDGGRVSVIPPSIDAFSAKNQAMTPETVHAILVAAGLVADPAPGRPQFVRQDGSPGRVDRRAAVFEEAPLTSATPLVVQVSRWDRLKDPVGVMDGFVGDALNEHAAHLLLAAPAVGAVTDDPEGADVLAECLEHWRALPAPLRERVHLACLPMDDPEENAAMVNALQRHATVIVQKSVAEGFGLTVAEGMWKGRPVVASRVGGIQDQVVDGETGLLVDPGDLAAFGRAVRRLLDDPS